VVHFSKCLNIGESSIQDVSTLFVRIGAKEVHSTLSLEIFAAAKRVREAADKIDVAADAERMR
jgi:hypothetical protein